MKRAAAMRDEIDAAADGRVVAIEERESRRAQRRREKRADPKRDGRILAGYEGLYRDVFGSGKAR